MENEHLSVVVEAKKVHSAFLWAVPQAQDYASPFPNCRRLVVTDGLRYGIFTGIGESKEFSLHAYLNLTRLRNEYPIYGCKGAKDAILAMTPEWQPDSGKLKFEQSSLAAGKREIRAGLSRVAYERE